MTIGSILGMVLFHNGSPKAETVAKVNGTIITREQVNKRIQVTQIMNNTMKEWIPKVQKSSQINVSQWIFADDFQSVTVQLIRVETIHQYLSSQGHALSYDEVCEETDRTMTELSADAAYQEAFKNALHASQTTQEEFMQPYYSYAYDVLCTESAKTLFQESDEFDKNSSKSLDEQFSAFVDSLIQQADIVYN